MRVLKRLSIRSKFIILMLIVTITSIMAIGFIGNRSGEKIIKSSVTEKLQLLNSMKAEQIKEYFASIESSLKMLSSDRMVLDALREFIISYNLVKYNALTQKEQEELIEYYKKQILPKIKSGSTKRVSLENILPKSVAANYLQYHYLVKNQFSKERDKLIAAKDDSSYTQTHKKYHQSLREIANYLGFEDLYFIDAESGEIVYSVKKGIDFASDLKVGSFRKSNLANLSSQLNRSVAKDAIVMVDFESYLPSFGRPEAFAGITLYDGDEFLGVLAVKIGVAKINQILSANHHWSKLGLGESGEIYIVGSDYKMRSESRYLITDPKKFFETLEKINTPKEQIEAIKRYKSTILHLEVKNETTQKALNGKVGVEFGKNYLGEEALNSYAPLNIGFFNWGIIVSQNLKEAQSAITYFREKFAISTIVIIFLVTLFAMLTARVFTKPMNALIEGVKSIGKKQVPKRVAIESSDEFGELARSFNEIIKKMSTQELAIAQKDQEIHTLLLDIMPESIAKRYIANEKNIIEKHSNVTILFTSLTGLSEIYERYSHEDAFKRHNDLFESFDNAANELGIERIKTVGDDYMAASGLINPRFNHSQKAVEFAFMMLDIIKRFNQENGTNIGIRIGLDAGEVYAGLVGNIKIEYNVWGNTVDIASALRYYTDINSIRITKEVYDALVNKEEFVECSDIENHEFGTIKNYQYRKC